MAQFAAEASADALLSDDKLKISKSVKNVADIHTAIHPEEKQQNQILNVAVLVNGFTPVPSQTPPTLTVND